MPGKSAKVWSVIKLLLRLTFTLLLLLVTVQIGIESFRTHPCEQIVENYNKRHQDYLDREQSFTGKQLAGSGFVATDEEIYCADVYYALIARRAIFLYLCLNVLIALFCIWRPEPRYVFIM